MDASYKNQRGLHVHLIQFFMCPEFWVHIKTAGVAFALYQKASLVLQSTLSLFLPHKQKLVGFLE